MRRRVQSTLLLAIAAVWMLPLRADVAAAATITIDLVAGSDPLGDPVVNPPGGTLSHFESNGFGSVQALASASIDGWSTHFDTFAKSDNTVGALSRAILTVDQSDTVAVTRGTPPPSLILRFLLTGFVGIGPGDGDGDHVGSLKVNGASYDLSVPGPIADPNESVQALIDVLIPLTDTPTPLSVQVQSDCAALSQAGLCHADFDSTLRLVKILLPNGQTPESQGMGLQFGSGLSSPNLYTIVESRFDVDGEGWRIGDFFAPSPSDVPQYLADGGNPGGFVRTGDVFAWNAYHAPAAFLGDKSAAYGGVLHLDQRALGPNTHVYPMVVMSDGALMLQFPTDPPGSEWKSYDIPLVASAGWEICDGTGNPGPPASEAQLRQVLGSLSFLHLDADWRSGIDQVDLDNVQLLPEPGFSTLLCSGLAGVIGCARIRSRRPRDAR
jgi:laminin B (domain IV)